jgi:cellulose synthase/poly-beta-1,6-N-acetylglucosamine synthase-like glycosyltransferase
VLIPAHNEEAVLGRTLAAVKRALRPGDLLLVVDDRSLDRTASIAQEHGAMVLSRTPDQEPGRAAARQDGLRLGLTLAWDAVAMIDADSVVEPEYLNACEAVLASGAMAVQARSEASTGGGVMSQTFLAAFALQSVTIPRGRDRLGLSVRLKGTGMVIRRVIAEQYRFRGPGASEDLCFSLDLCRDGILPRHAESAHLRSQSATSVGSASGQRRRWEAGRMLMAREHVGPLLRRHDPAAIEAAVHLVTLPFALAALSLATGGALFAAAGHAVLALARALLLGLLIVDLVIALIEARAAAATWFALLTAPAYVLWKLWVHAGAVITVIRREKLFPATLRESERP